MPRGVYKRKHRYKGPSERNRQPNLRRDLLKAAAYHRLLSTELSKLARRIK